MITLWSLNGYANAQVKPQARIRRFGVVKIMSLVHQTKIWTAPALFHHCFPVMVKTARKDHVPSLVGFDETMTSATTYHQEAVICVGVGSENTAVMTFGAIGKGC